MRTGEGKKGGPRILVVTPEITYLPAGMGNMADRLTAKAGGLADVSASLVSALFDLGADVHVALPHYRRMFNVDVGKLISEELRVYKRKMPGERVHLAEDRIFYYRDAVYASEKENPKLALTFQREVINNILPSVKPDLVHCNDWMTGLVPAMARRLGIPCLFTLHNIHTQALTVSAIEDRGIDTREFWPYLYFQQYPSRYEDIRDSNPVDLLASGIFSAHYINTVSPSFLAEVTQGAHDFIPGHIRREIAMKEQAGCAVGILNAPDPTYDPATDTCLAQRYTADTMEEGRAANKRALQEATGLDVEPDAAVFFWPSRLDPVQKGCSLLGEILAEIVYTYWHDGLQVVFVANGAYQPTLHDIVRRSDLDGRAAVCDFSEPLSRLAYAGSDFMLMPSRFEPCGLPQMISPLYGNLPLVHETGGLRDTVEPLDVGAGTGNGFVFKHYDANGLRWAVDQAMAFHRLPSQVRTRQIARIMRESAATFNHEVTARRYFEIYERMLQRPLVNLF